MGFRPSPSIFPDPAAVTLLLHMTSRNRSRWWFAAVLVALLTLNTVPRFVPASWQPVAHAVLISVLIGATLLLIWSVLSNREAS